MTTLLESHAMQAVTFAATSDEYHSLPGVSNSRLSDFIEPDGSPELYFGRYVSDPPLFAREESTEAMQFGTNVHAVIQAGSLDAVFTVIPRDALNGDGHRKGAAWKQFAEENAGKTLVKDEEVVAYRHILNNVKAHEKAAAILYGGHDGHTEFNIRWTDEETGLLCRARLDRVWPTKLIADIKTTTTVDPRRFSQAIYSWGYHRQAAFYQTAWSQYTKGDGQFGEALPFVFIAVLKKPPFTVACYTLRDDYLQRGYAEVRKALRELYECYESGHWAGPEEIIELSEPAYAKFQDQWEAA